MGIIGATDFEKRYSFLIDEHILEKERAEKVKFAGGTFNNGKQGAMIIVQKQSGANSVEISNKIKEVLPSIQKGLPSDVKLDYIVDTSDNIRNTINSLIETVLYALLFVVIVVLVSMSG